MATFGTSESKRLRFVNQFEDASDDDDDDTTTTAAAAASTTGEGSSRTQVPAKAKNNNNRSKGNKKSGADRAAASLFFSDSTAPRHSGERLSAADGLDSAEWEEAVWSGSDGGDELDQLETTLLGEVGGAGAAGSRGGEALRSRFESKLNTASRDGGGGGEGGGPQSQSVRNDIKRSEKSGEKTSRHTGRDDRATVEQVMDPRTRMILFKLLNHGFFRQIDGCLSTGKEANVYYAVGGEGKEYAIKVYKTSILVFKDRDKYVSGEYRYRHGYCRSNPRKMVKVWAEKEMRNLKRLVAAGIPSPAPVLIKNNVLVMDFLGKAGWPAPRLRDVQLGPKKMKDAYIQCVIGMRNMYQKCRLVHGDLSEYNLLYMEGLLIFIDVSQSMENDHPRAMDFLRMDCRNVTAFFKKKGAQPASARSLFGFVIDSDLQEDRQEERLKEVLEKEFDEAEAFEDESKNGGGKSEKGAELAAELEIQDAVFMSSYIPRSLHEVDNVEDRQNRIQQEQREGGKGTAYAIAVTHMLKQDPKKDKHPAINDSISTPSNSVTAPAAAVGNPSGRHTKHSLKAGSAADSLSGSTSAAAAAAAAAVVVDTAGSGGDGGAPVAGGQQSGVVSEGGGGGGKAGVQFVGVREEDGGRNGDAAGAAAIVVVEEDSVSVSVVAGGDGAGSDGDASSSDGYTSSGADMSGSDDFEDDDEEEGQGEGHTRRNWAERRARLRKDGMHGRRLPPPQAEEERATAKAEKREVISRHFKSLQFTSLH
ncbi:unnamed protein product [Ectocarpus sp. CCAP 1310/34]|nr:unnamed protein product [Ectocarpus sp. CCAP 1310/34]